MKYVLVFLFGLTISRESFSQRKTPLYSVDSSMRQRIDEKVAAFDGRANASITYTIYEGEKAIASSKNAEGALAFTTFSNNLVAIDCLNGINNGFGFFLAIGADTSFVKFKILSSSEKLMFKSSVDDAPKPELLLNCRVAKVALTAAPLFKQGEVISGRVELEGDSFYEVKDGRERKIRFRIACDFKSEPLPVVDKKYKTLQRI